MKSLYVLAALAILAIASTVFAECKCECHAPARATTTADPIGALYGAVPVPTPGVRSARPDSWPVKVRSIEVSPVRIDRATYREPLIRPDPEPAPAPAPIVPPAPVVTPAPQVVYYVAQPQAQQIPTYTYVIQQPTLMRASAVRCGPFGRRVR